MPKDDDEIKRDFQVKTDNVKNKVQKGDVERTVTLEEIPVEAEGIAQVKITVTVVGPSRSFKILQAKGLVAADPNDESPPELTMILKPRDTRQSKVTDHT